jgi:hypothetical protein
LFVFATVHTAFNHPLVTAKAGDGRPDRAWPAGLEHRRLNKPEYDAMGSTCRAGPRRPLRSHRSGRARQAVVDGRGRWDVRAASEPERGRGSPKPYDGLLLILNAGSSTQGSTSPPELNVFTVVAA